MRKCPVITLLLTALTVPVAVQAQEGQAVDARPYVLGSLYNDPTPVDLLEPSRPEGIAGGTVRAATVELPEGPLAMALREVLEKGETLDELSLSVGNAGERSPYFPGSTKYTTIKLARVRVTSVSPGDRYGRVKVQFHWDRTEAPAGDPLIGKAIGNVAATPNEGPEAQPPPAGQGWYRTTPTITIPATAARFSITIDGVEIASFSELAGINSRVEPVEIVFKRGKTRRPEMLAWHEAVREGNMAAARKSASLVMYDYDGKPIARYHLENAWPSKIEIGGLAAQGNVSDFEFLKARASRGGEVAMETVTMVCESIQRVAQ
ncbi:MAG TPA: phage tail protein [Gemmatimonadota bacterium]|nr:phage tail protein [Gemmatimonadota bacterium]